MCGIFRTKHYHIKGHYCPIRVRAVPPKNTLFCLFRFCVCYRHKVYYKLIEALQCHVKRLHPVFVSVVLANQRYVPREIGPSLPLWNIPSAKLRPKLWGVRCFSITGTASSSTAHTVGWTVGTISSTVPLRTSIHPPVHSWPNLRFTLTTFSLQCRPYFNCLFFHVLRNYNLGPLQAC